MDELLQTAGPAGGVVLLWVARELWGQRKRAAERDEEGLKKTLEAISAKLDAITTALARHDTARELHDVRLDRVEADVQMVRARDHELVSTMTAVHGRALVALEQACRASEAALRLQERRSSSGLHPAVRTEE